MSRLMKNCTKCKKTKSSSEFHKDNHQKSGLRPDCKDCVKAWRLNNKKSISLQIKSWKDDNKEKVKNYSKSWYRKNKPKVLKYNRKRTRNLRRSNITFKLEGNLRRRILDAIKFNRKSKKSLQLLGCSVEFLKQYLESQFTDGMTWDNYGFYGWHVDHIKPCARFDLSKESEQRACFHYTNLQPLWAIDNFKKGSR